MGIKLGGILKALITVGASVISLFQQKKEVSVVETLPFVVGQLLPAVQQAIAYGGLTTKEQFDEWLVTADHSMGSELTAVNLIKGMPGDKEEMATDHLIETARIYGYYLLKVPGFYVEGA